MHFADRVTVHAPAARVWAFLLDPDRVVRCFPEVDRLERLSPTTVRASVPIRVAFLTLHAVVDIDLLDQLEPERATFGLHATGPGSSVEGRATFTLTEGPSDEVAKGATAEASAGPPVGAATGQALTPAGSTLVAWSVDVEPKGMAASVGAETVARQAAPILQRAIECLRRAVETA